MFQANLNLEILNTKNNAIKSLYNIKSSFLYAVKV